jgi:hypothetical protein
MPKMDGFQLYESLKKIDPDVKACFLYKAILFQNLRFVGGWHKSPYSLTLRGRVVYDLQMIIGEALSNYWELKTFVLGFQIYLSGHSYFAFKIFIYMAY